MEVQQEIQRKFNDAPRIAYESYAKSSGWKSLMSGAPLPQWPDLDPQAQEAWKASAFATINYLKDDVISQVLDTTSANDILNHVRVQFEDFFSLTFNAIRDVIHNTAISKGWWDTHPSDIELLERMHAEIYECVKALKVNNPPSLKIPTFSSLEEKLADTIIIIMDLAKARNLNIAGAILAKSKFNTTRPRMHTDNIL